MSPRKDLGCKGEHRGKGHQLLNDGNDDIVGLTVQRRTGERAAYRQRIY